MSSSRLTMCSPSCYRFSALRRRRLISPWMECMPENAGSISGLLRPHPNTSRCSSHYEISRGNSRDVVHHILVINPSGLRANSLQANLCCLYLSTLRCSIPCKYWALVIIATLPCCVKRHNHFIRRKILTLTGQPAAVQRCAIICSSGQHFAFSFLQISPHDRHSRGDRLAVQLTLPLAGCVEDLHLQVTRLTTSVSLVALTCNAPCPTPP